ncbi:MAG: ABC transporter permease [Xanthobacteraceae bacterium]|nr:ABC transporter permease [Xanthobacteraceae bacterium]
MAEEALPKLAPESTQISPEYSAYLATLRRRALTVRLWQLGIICFVLVIWQVAPQRNWVNPMLTSYPTAVASTMVDFIRNGSLLYHTWSTLFSTFIGFTGSMLIGLAFAVAFWSFSMFYRVLDPYMVVLNALPKIALVPIFYIWLGDNASIYAMAIVVSVFVTTLMLYTGFQSIDADKIKLVQLYGASRFDVIRKVLLPGTVPMMISTLKVNVGLSLVGVVVGEFQSAKSGLGYLIVYGSQIFQMNLVMTSVVMLGFISAILFMIIQFLETRLVTQRGFR